MHPVWPRMAHYNPYIIFDKIVLKERGGGWGAWKSSMLSYRHLWIYEIQIIITDPGGFYFVSDK